MSEKLTEQKIDKMIQELLQEKSADALDRDYDDKQLKYYSGDTDYHVFDKNNSTKQVHTDTKPSRQNLADLAAQDSPDSQLDVKDIKKVLQMIVHGKVNDVKNSKGKFKDWLFLSKKDLEDRGSPGEKKHWNAALKLMLRDAQAEQASGDSRYRMNTKTNWLGINFENYLIDGVEIDNPKYYKQNWLLIKFDPNPAEEEEIEFSKTTQVQVDADLFNLNIANNPSEIGKFPAGVAQSADVIFQNTQNLPQRMRLITALTQEMAFPQSKTISSPEEMSKQYAKVVFYDYINEIARNMDDRASAYLFESFLALCAGGRVEGAQAAEDQTTMGATDFTIGEGDVKGSCKYYSTKSNISQAISGFDNNEPVHYIIAIKKKDKNPQGQKIIREISIYYIKILVEKLQRKVNVSYFAPNGQKLLGMSLPTKGDKAVTEVPIHMNQLYRSESLIGDIELLSDDRHDYKSTLENNLKTININLSDLVSKTSDISSDSRQMNRNTRQYIMQDDKTSGDQAVGDLNRIIANMQSLFDTMTDLGFKKSEAEVTLPDKTKKESKLQSLDDLIMETIRDIKKKTKK